jgi:tRNA modification GTPase
LDLDDTIAAIATAPGSGLRGVIRLSGPDCVAIVGRLFQHSEFSALRELRRPYCGRGTFDLPRGLGPLPATLYLWPTGRSYTRQPSAELHLPGSPPLLSAALARACQAGARLAHPGEFTMRAFLAGRLDLTQAEAVLGVIDAQGRQELDVALAQLAGGLARPLAAVRERLLDLLAQLEAGLDFVDEDIDFISRDELHRQLLAAEQFVEGLVQQMEVRGEAGRLPRIVLVGLPNVGKSSLFNALAGDEAAIVSEVAGTTRDYVTRRVSFGARHCLITDTAGIATPNDAGIDVFAQSTARKQAKEADLILLCLDASLPPAAWERQAIAGESKRERLVVWTKCDLAHATNVEVAMPAIETSSRTGAGLETLMQEIAQALEGSISESGMVGATVDRCRESLRLAGAALSRARAAVTAALGDELVAAEVRGALDELGRVVGAVYTDDILDRVFSRFCIGK